MKKNATKKTIVLAIGRTGIKSNAATSFDVGNCLSLLFLQKYALSDEKIRDIYRIEVVGLVSTNEGENEEFLKIVEELKPDMLGFSCFLWNVESTMEMCGRIKKNLPDVKILLGGPEMNNPAAALECYEQADFVIVGEGEEPFRKLLLEFASDSPNYDSVPALSFRNRDREVVNAQPEILNDLDVIPVTFTPELMKKVHGEVYYTSSRGCRNRCKYCSAANQKVRFFPLERIEEEIKAILSTKSVSLLQFLDSTVNIDNERFVALLDIIARHNKHRIPCSGFVSMGNIDEKIMEMMRRACFVHVTTGIEATNDEILKKAGRPNIKKSTIQNYLAFERDPLFHVSYTAMYIIPGDTYEGFKKTLKNCVGSGMRNICPSRVLILPGTRYQINSYEEGLDYDRRPPYFLRSCRSFSRMDVMKAEQLAINIRIILNFVHESDRIYLQKRGIDIVDMAEEIHELFPEWLSLYDRRSMFDSEVFCRRPEICDIIGAYVELKIKSEKEAEFFSKLLNIRKVQHAFTNNNPFLQVKAKEKATPSKRVQVLEHQLVSFSYDYNSYVESPGKTPPAVEPERAFCCVALHPAHRKGFVYQSRNINVAKRVLEVLKKQKPETTLKAIYKDFSESLGMEFDDYMSIVQELCDNGLIGLST